MNPRSVLLIVLCALSAACFERDTELRGEWARTVEPRLSGAVWRDPHQLPRRYRPRGACETTVDTHEDAIRVLSTDLRCVDAAIARLESLQQWSDLAAAYLIRAGADHQPLDELLALEAADRAVQTTPLNPAAQFNRGLIQEKLGLYELALTSYASLRYGTSQWANEAKRRHAALRDKLTVQPLVPQLDAALRRHDAAAVAKIIEFSPVRAQQYLESVVIPRGDAAQAAILAKALSARLGDPYFVDEDGRRDNLSASIQEVATTGDLVRLDALERKARAGGYRTLLAKCAWIRALVVSFRGDYLSALEQYDSAARQFLAMRDFENGAAARFRHAGVLTAAGTPDRAWEELLQIDQRFLSPKELQAYSGELARAANELGHPAVALQYRDLAVHRIRNEIRATDPRDLATLAKLRVRLGTALRGLAEAEIQVNRLRTAGMHLQEAVRLSGVPDPTFQRRLEARIAEANAKRLLIQSPELAPAEFARAEALTDPESRSLRVKLVVQQAIAHRAIGKRNESVADLQRALALLAEEERDILQKDLAAGETIWSGYFSRFEDAYALLIAQTAAANPETAFDYAERARGFEPLHRLQQLPYAPREFQRIAAQRRLADIRSVLPPGTFLLEYSVLDDRTYTWVIWRDGMQLVTQATTKSSVQRWTSNLQRAAARDDVDAFDRGLYAPYTGLIAEPLAVVRKHQPQGDARLVFIPDRNMQGLPLAALRNSRTNRYLIEDATIETQGSALLYVFSLMRDRELALDRSLLLIGNPSFDHTLPYADRLGNLRFAEDEVRTILDLYGQGELLLNEHATIAEFLQKARAKAIVHIAAHAVVNARQPHLSAILLARVSDRDRGALDVEHFIREARLERTRLVVLSACSSAGGSPVGPEGVGPLVRPILTAGVPAVLGTLWPVYDATAERVLVSFQRGFHEGSDAAAALRDAQRGLIGKRTHALTWAPYQVIGHATSPFSAPTEKEKPP